MTDAGLAAQLLVTFGGLFLLGLLADLAGRIRPGEPTQAEALGFVLLAAGLAAWRHVSLILSAMVLGAVGANLATHHQRAFRAIEGYAGWTGTLAAILGFMAARLILIRRTTDRPWR